MAGGLQSFGRYHMTICCTYALTLKIAPAVGSLHSTARFGAYTSGGVWKIYVMNGFEILLVR